VARDLVHPGATKAVRLDCLDCGACCHSNRVELEPADVERLREAGRTDLLRMPYARKIDGKLVFRLDEKRACRHLLRDNRCRIYELRPSMCRVFPMASECCLSARAEELGIWDGADPG
jgi:Fe-S-cluster containining protein